jgi:hypothetical protein
MTLILPRRTLLKAGVGVLTSIIAAPMIGKADWLMDIDSKQNRLVYAFRTDRGYIPSMLDLVTIINPEIRKWWEDEHHINNYAFVRQAEIEPGKELCYGGTIHPRSPEDMKGDARWVQHRIDRFMQNRHLT